MDLDDELRSLLDFLNARRRKVALSSPRAILGLSRHIELELLDLFTSQLDRELIFHNVMVNDLKRRMSEMFLKARGLLGAMAELKQEKVYFEVRLLSRLEELHNVWNEVSDLLEKVGLAQSELSSLRKQIDKERAKKLAL